MSESKLEEPSTTSSHGEAGLEGKSEESKSPCKPDEIIDQYRGVPKKKKMLEEDAMLLRNRIRHLQFELNKTKKKVDETSVRAKEIKQMKEKNASKRKERKKEMSETYGLSAERAKVMKQQQEEARQKMLRQKEAKQEEIRKETERRKKERERIKAEKLLAKKREEEETKRRVKERRKQVERKKRLEEEAIRRKAEQRLQEAKDQLIIERTEARQLANMIENLENQEQNWIEKLKDALAEQRKVYQELEQELAFDHMSSSEGKIAIE